MTYRINKTDGSILADVLDESIDVTSSDLTLIGKNVPFYGEYINENFVRLLENFSSKHAPIQPIKGQLWYDKSDKRLKVYSGKEFKTAGGPIVSNTQPDVLTRGDMWIDSAENQLHFYDGTDLILVGPIYKESQGLSGFQVASVYDANGFLRTILKLWVGKTLLGIFSKDSTTFALREEIPNFSGTIKPGFNASNLSGLIFNVTSSSADSVYNSAGELKFAKDFMITNGDTGTTGTVSIKNKTSLILGPRQDNTFYIADDSFRIVGNNTNQNVRLTTSPTLPGIFINTENRNIGIFKNSPTAMFDVAGSINISSDIFVNGLSSSTRNLEIVNSFLTLNYGETGQGVTSNYASLAVDRGQLLDTSIRWNEYAGNWELATDTGIYSKLLNSSDLSPLAVTGSYKDLINVPVSFGSDANWGKNGSAIYSIDNIRIGSIPQGSMNIAEVPVQDVMTNPVFAANIYGATAAYSTSGKSSLVTDNTIDLTLGTYFIKRVVGETKFRVVNIAPAGMISSFIIQIENGGSSVVKWMPFTRWQTSVPQLTAFGTDILGFYSTDAGVTWYGMLLGKNVTSGVSINYWINRLTSNLLIGNSSNISTNIDSFGASAISGNINLSNIDVPYIAKFSPYSDLLWANTFTSTVGTVSINKVTLLSTGYFLVSGTIKANVDKGLIFYMDPAGTIVWQKLLASPYSMSNITSAEAVGTTDLYVTGYTDAYISGTVSLFLSKFSLIDGSMIWQHFLNPAIETDEYVPHKMIHKTGNLYIVGTRTSINQTRSFVAIYDIDGILQTEFSIESLGNISGLSAVASATHLYICGSVVLPSGSITGYVSKIDLTGNVIWSKYLQWPDFDAQPGGIAKCYSISFDSSLSNLLIAGSKTLTVHTATSIGVSAKISIDGSLIWARSITSIGGTAEAKDIIVDSQNQYFISLNTDRSVNFLIKLPADGTLTSTYQVGTEALTYDVLSVTLADFAATQSTTKLVNYSIIKSPAMNWQYAYSVDKVQSRFSNIYYTGWTNSYPQAKSITHVNAITADGVDQWSIDVSDSADLVPLDLVVDSTGSCIIIADANATNLIVFKINHTGILWSYSFPSTISIEKLAIDSANNCYVLGMDSVGAVLTKLTPIGSVEWSLNLPNYDITYSTIKIVGDGVYISGTTFGSIYGAIVIKIATAGTIVWQKQLVTNESCRLGGLTVSADESIYLALTASTSYFLLKLSSSGEIRWQLSPPTNGQSSYSAGLTVGSTGDVYFALQTTSSPLYVIQVAPDGTFLNHLSITGFKRDNNRDISITVSEANDVYINGYITQFGGIDGVFKICNDFRDSSINIDPDTVDFWTSLVDPIYVNSFSFIDYSIIPETMTINISNYPLIVDPTPYNLEIFAETLKTVEVYEKTTPFYYHWFRWYNGVQSSLGYGFYLDSYENMHISASTNNIRTTDAFVSKISKSGQITFSKSIGSVISTVHGMKAVSGKYGDTYLAALGLGVLKINNAGDLIWNLITSLVIWDLAVDDLENVYVICKDENTKAALLKIDTTGQIVWKKHLVTNSSQGFIRIKHLTNALYITGYDSPSGQTPYDFVMKVTYDGNVEWSRALVGTSVGIVCNIDINSAGAMYVTGSNNSGYIFVNKFNPNFSLAWSKKLYVGAEAHAIHVDSFNNIYIGTVNNGSPTLIKLSSTGTLIWSRKINVYNNSNFLGGVVEGISTNGDSVYILVSSGELIVAAKLAIDGTGAGSYTSSTVQITYVADAKAVIGSGSITWQAATLQLELGTFTPAATVPNYNYITSTNTSNKVSLDVTTLGPLEHQTGDVVVGAAGFGVNSVSI